MRHISLVLLSVVTVIGCGGGGDGGGGGPALVFTSLALAPANPNIIVNGSVTLSATPKDQNGGNMVGLPAATFSSSNAAVATVTSPGGVVTARTSGSADITASVTTAGGITKSATTRVTVSAVGLTAAVGNVGNSWSPDRVDIARTGTVTFSISTGTHNVTFNVKAGAPSDIPNCANCSEGKQFNTVDAQNGFPYQCTIHAGMNGVVYVH